MKIRDIASLICDVFDDEFELRQGEVAWVLLQGQEFLFHLKNAEFGLIKKMIFCGPKLSQLTTDFRPDAARTPR
jgi:hypothetical protein